MLSSFTRQPLVLLSLTLLVVGCSPAESDSETDLGGWTIEEDALTLEEDLHVSDGDDFYFGAISDLAIRSDSRIYVADPEEHHIKVLSEDGELLETIGREGEGPGEFQRPSEVALARGDSLFVLDSYWGRVSVFSPEHDFAYSFEARGEEGASPGNMMAPDDEDRFYFSYSFVTRAVMQDEDPVELVQAFSEEGGDTLFFAPPPPIAFEAGDGWVSFYFVPFSRRSHYAYGPDRLIHHAWGDSLTVTVYDQQGEQQRVVPIPFEPVPIASEELDEYREWDSWSIIREHVLETKPAFDHFLIDNAGRYWFKRPTEDPERADWWIVEPEDERIVIVPLPSEVHFHVVRDGYAYGRSEGEHGEPALVRYRIVE